ncbi:sigma-54-dependent transcriptional regulator [Marinicellulosiphila megalodicopiae]|uniref:sigma-54-dependent transcriptional regulator n=1 Tax=Marinicellulosiphila megalodicopiae TaxID=2724896 RepID=UPI003BAF36DC
MKVLIVEDDHNLREALVDTLSIANIDCIEASCGEEAIVKLDQASFVVTDVNMPGIDGHELLQFIRQKRPDIPVVLATAFGDVSKAVQAMHEGAVDYLIKPFKSDQLISLINKYQGQPSGDFDDPIAYSQSSQRCLMMAKKVAKTDSTILISGESGTGKEVLARYIHQYSDRKNKPFIAINCAAIPENMLEATLFGHEKGAFTGAHQSMPGKFEQANGGTILLDEISEMEIGLQAKLLRVLQEREVERIGGRKTIELDVRVLATTNRDLKEYVAEHKFREDLYYRLNVFPLKWAPLRERQEDIIPIANFILKKICAKMHKAMVSFDNSAQRLLTTYQWPGNIRELDNAIQRAMILQSGQSITADDLGLQDEVLSLNQHQAYNAFQAQDQQNVDHSARGEIHSSHEPYFENKFEAAAFEPVQEQVNSEENLSVDLKHKEFELILDAIKSEGGSKGKAADRLGISSRTLRYKLAKMRDLGMKVDERISALH